jgi:hypothetical protein
MIINIVCAIVFVYFAKLDLELFKKLTDKESPLIPLRPPGESPLLPLEPPDSPLLPLHPPESCEIPPTQSLMTEDFLTRKVIDNYTAFGNLTGTISWSQTIGTIYFDYVIKFEQSINPIQFVSGMFTIKSSGCPDVIANSSERDVWGNLESWLPAVDHDGNTILY